MRSTQSITYRGPFRGGDPRNFIPDTDTCTSEQIENWLTHCRIWNAAAAHGGDPLLPEPMQGDNPENSAFGLGYQGSVEIEAADKGQNYSDRYEFRPRPNATDEEFNADMAAFLARFEK